MLSHEEREDSRNYGENELVLFEEAERSHTQLFKEKAAKIMGSKSSKISLNFEPLEDMIRSEYAVNIAVMSNGVEHWIVSSSWMIL